MKKQLLLALLAGATVSAYADPSVKDLQQQINMLADQLESQSSASSSTKVGGYGELHYNNNKNTTNQIDFHRYVLFVDHEFNDRIRFASEMELEHSAATASGPGAVELEQGYIEMDLSPNSSLQTGILLVPVGILNETHEPATFYGVERNPIENKVIPTTWSEGGVMYSSRLDNGLSYDLAVHSGFKTTTSVRSGRQKVAEANADNFAYTARVKYTGITGLKLSLTYQNQSDMDQIANSAIGSGNLLEAHAIYTLGKLKLTALTASWNINGMYNTKGSLLEASYKFNPQWGIFARQNNWNTDSNGERQQFNTGVNYWPHEDVVFKFDLQQQNATAGDNDGFNVGIGYQF